MSPIWHFSDLTGLAGDSPFLRVRRTAQLRARTSEFDPKRASRPYGTIIVKIMLCLKPAG